MTYTPKPLQTIDGDRRVFGFDYKLPLGGKRGFIHYSQATVNLDNDINPLSGTARGLKAEYNFGDLRAHASLKDVPANFVTVETRGFNRNEKAIDVGLEYRKREWAWGDNATNSNIAYRQIRQDGTTQIRTSQFSNQRAFVNFTPAEKGITWALEHNHTQSEFSGTDTKIDTTALLLSL